MFNSKFKKDTISILNLRKEEYLVSQKNLTENTEVLYKERTELKKIVDKSWEYVNELKNTPVDLKTEINEIKVNTDRFAKLLEIASKEIENIDFKAAGTAAAGVVAGVSVAALGPSAAMGIAMAFGTASTGTAISALSGAAATNAALAWIGGGALAAGGGGMVAGQSFLLLTGPIGWAIGGVGLTAAGLMANGKNKKQAVEAYALSVEVEAKTKVLKGLIEEINLIVDNIQLVKNALPQLLEKCRVFGNDYVQLTNDQKYLMGTLVNNTLAAAGLLNKVIGESVANCENEQTQSDNLETSSEKVSVQENASYITSQASTSTAIKMDENIIEGGLDKLEEGKKQLLIEKFKEAYNKEPSNLYTPNQFSPSGYLPSKPDASYVICQGEYDYDEIIEIFDTSISGNGKSGLALTTDSICVKDGGNYSSKFIAKYKDIERLDHRYTKFFRSYMYVLEIHMKYGRKYEVSVERYEPEKLQKFIEHAMEIC